MPIERLMRRLSAGWGRLASRPGSVAPELIGRATELKKALAAVQACWRGPEPDLRRPGRGRATGGGTAGALAYGAGRAHDAARAALEALESQLYPACAWLRRARGLVRIGASRGGFRVSDRSRRLSGAGGQRRPASSPDVADTRSNRPRCMWFLCTRIRRPSSPAERPGRVGYEAIVPAARLGPSWRPPSLRQRTCEHSPWYAQRVPTAATRNRLNSKECQV